MQNTSLHVIPQKFGAGSRWKKAGNTLGQLMAMSQSPTRPTVCEVSSEVSSTDEIEALDIASASATPLGAHAEFEVRSASAVSIPQIHTRESLATQVEERKAKLVAESALRQAAEQKVTKLTVDLTADTALGRWHRPLDEAKDRPAGVGRFHAKLHECRESEASIGTAETDRDGTRHTMETVRTEVANYADSGNRPSGEVPRSMQGFVQVSQL